MANRSFPLILVALAAAGCAAPSTSDFGPGVTVTAQLALTEASGRRLMQTVSPWTATDVALAKVVLFKDNPDPTPDEQVGTKDVTNAQLGGTISFSNLRRNTNYMIVTEAYTSTDERIDNYETSPSSCTTTFTVGTATPVSIGAIKLALRNKGFNGTSSGNALDITAGDLDEPSGPETIDVVMPSPAP